MKGIMFEKMGEL